MVASINYIFRNKECPCPIPNVSQKHKRVSAVKKVASVLLSPVTILYWYAHRIAGRIIIPASQRSAPAEYERNFHLSKTFLKNWVIRRLEMRVGKEKIDAVAIVQKRTQNNGRWVLFSNGNNQLLEDTLYGLEQRVDFLQRLEANALLFNYPGVGKSSGQPCRKSAAKAYRAFLQFLEDKKKGIGAKEIIGYGYSLGGAVQADALRKHQCKNDIKYVFVKRQTFSNLRAEANALLSRPLGLIVALLGWNIDVAASSAHLKVPEIIIQTTAEQVAGKDPLPEQVRDDGVISAKASLMKELLTRKKTWPNKAFIGVATTHNEQLQEEDVEKIACKIEEFLRSY